MCEWWRSWSRGVCHDFLLIPDIKKTSSLTAKPGWSGVDHWYRLLANQLSFYGNSGLSDWRESNWWSLFLPCKWEMHKKGQCGGWRIRWEHIYQFHCLTILTETLKEVKLHNFSSTTLLIQSGLTHNTENVNLPSDGPTPSSKKVPVRKYWLDWLSKFSLMGPHLICSQALVMTRIIKPVGAWFTLLRHSSDLQVAVMCRQKTWGRLQLWQVYM